MVTVYTTGVFDILHRGHINVLLEAKKLGDRLVVGIQDDESVYAAKGKYPTLSVQERVAQLESLPFVDEVIVYEGTEQISHLKKIAPQIMVQGDDWFLSGEREAIIRHLKKHDIRLVLVPYTEEISSSEIKKRVLHEGQRTDRDFIFKNVKLVPIEELRLYERYEEGKVLKLMEKIQATQVFFNPITVNEYKIVIDGVNRLEALRRLKVQHVPCLVVNYKDIELAQNVHFKKKDGTITRLSEFNDSEGERIEFPRYTKEDIIRMVQEGEMVDNGATWHKVPIAVIRLRIPLDKLITGFDFDVFLKSTIAAGNIRYYPANVYVCDEWE